MNLFTKTSCKTFTLLSSPKPNTAINTWQSFTVAGFSSNVYGHEFWTDGTNIYFSYEENQYVLNKETRTWETKTWNGLTSFRGQYIWTDGTNIYFSQSAKQYVLNKETSTWEEKTWYGWNTAWANGLCIWKDGDTIYHANCYGGTHYNYVLNKDTDTWEEKTWNGLPSSFYGHGIWSDGTNIYYTFWHDHLILNKDTDTWETKTWDALPSNSNGMVGSDIWTDGENIYASAQNGGFQYSVVLSGNSWVYKQWDSDVELDADHFWTDGNNIYCTQGESTACLPLGNQQLYTRKNGTWVKTGTIVPTS